MPLANAFRWDTGVQAHAANDLVDLTAIDHSRHALEPAVQRRQRRPPGGRTRRVHPVAGLIVGASAAHGPFVSSEAARAAVGGDERRRVRADGVGRRRRILARILPACAPKRSFSQWTMPSLRSPAIDAPSARAGHVRRGPLQDSSRLLRRRTRRPSGLQRDRRLERVRTPGMRR